jgi:hypothetical protein
VNTYGITITSKYIGIRDNMFRWECVVTRGKLSFETRFSMSFAHCKRLKTLLPRTPREPMTRELARALKPYGRLTVGDCEGFVYPNEPTIEDVLSALRLDAACGEPLLFEDFCSEFGYDTDSRKAEGVWRACQHDRGELQRLLGAEFDAFMAETEEE